MQQISDNPSKKDIEDMMHEADQDQDGRINFSEFVDMIHYQEQQNKTEY
jgi:Ca2+-binding EF-hand superfamily protein